MYLGQRTVGTVVYVPFHTFNSVGASVTITGFATTDIQVYKDGSITQRASVSGFTLLDGDGIDFDAITGIHGFKIDLSDNTDAGFFVAGSHYFVVIASVTVDSQTVNFLAASFDLVAAPATVTDIATGVWDTDATAHQTLGTFGQAIGDPVADANTIFKAVVTDATAATVGLDVVAEIATIGVAGAGLTAVVASGGGGGVTITQGSNGATGTNPLTFHDGTVRQTN